MQGAALAPRFGTTSAGTYLPTCALRSPGEAVPPIVLPAEEIQLTSETDLGGGPRIMEHPLPLEDHLALVPNIC